jgi:hypothetical protein
MTRVRYTRRLGQHQPGSVRDLTGSGALWLVQRGYATYEQQPAPQPAHQTQDQGDDTDAQSTQTQAGMEQDDGKTVTLADLKAQAEGLKLPTYGTKAQLMDRIEQARQSKGQDADEDDIDREN